MEVIYLLVPLSVAFLAFAVWVFFWAVRSEQYEDLEGPAHRIILDDREKRHETAARLPARCRPAAPAGTARDAGGDRHPEPPA